MDLLNLDNKLQEYLETAISPQDLVLSELSRYTFLKVRQPGMLSGPVQGKFLEFISKMISPEYILEIGTYTGYSAICLARGLKKGGKLLTIEINDELKAKNLEFFEKAGVSDKIELLQGDALSIIPSLRQKFDLIFIDGEKEEYDAYYELTIEKLRDGGFILVDNVLWSGKILDQENNPDSATRAISKFNKKIASDNRVESMILPVRDGISLIRKL